MADAPTKVLSRDFKIYANTGTEGAPTWTQVKGLGDDGIAISPSSSDVDFADADDAGWEKPVIIKRGYSVALKGDRLEAADGTRDPGQAAVEAMQDQMGLAGLLQFKIASPATTPETLIFKASVEATPFGGSDKSSWEASLRVYGQIARA
jgi:hypothetical protein